MADSDLRRTHPSTVIVGAAKLASQGFGIAIAAALIGVSSGGGRTALGLFGLVLFVVVLGLAFSALKWRVFRFGIVGNDLVIVEGLIVKRRRSIPVTRVQGIDVRADLLMRLLGVTEVIVQTAGGSSDEPEAKIGSITLAEAEELRHALLHRRSVATGAVTETTGAASSASDASSVSDASAEAAGGTATTGAAPDILGRMSDLRGAFGGAESARIEPSYRFAMTLPRLALSAITTRGALLVLAAMIGGVFQLMEIFDFFDAADDAGRAILSLGLLAIPLALAGILASAAVAIAVVIARDYGFTARRVDERVETEAGLIERRMTGLPVARIQAVTVDESPVQRWLGWVTVRAVSAGFGSKGDDEKATAPALIPLARRSEMPAILDGLLPEVWPLPRLEPLPARALRFYLTIPVVGTFTGVTVAAIVAWIVQPVAGAAVTIGGALLLIAVAAFNVLSWRHAAWGTDPSALGIASGMLGRRTVRIGRNRIQSLSVHQSPFQRRAQLATVIADGVTGSGHVAYRIRHVRAADAEALVEWYQRRSGVTIAEV